LPLIDGGTSRLSGLASRWFVPVPRMRHTIGFVISLAVMLSLNVSRAPELGEFALAILLAAVVLNPLNRTVLDT